VPSQVKRGKERVSGAAWAPEEASKGYSGEGGAQGGSPFDALFFPLAVLTPLAGIAFAGRFPVVLRAHPFLNTPPLVQRRAVTAWSVRRGCPFLQTVFRPAIRVQVFPADGNRMFFFWFPRGFGPDSTKHASRQGHRRPSKINSCRPGVVPWT